jgi:TPP-dependent pyruvate/acetoin dehydrogenase alpha subunit
MRCDGMDVVDTHRVLCEAVERVREERSPLLVEAVTYRFRGHSMADPEQYRTKEEVAHWRERDPIPAFAELLIAEGVIEEAERERIDAEAIARVDRAVEFAEASPFPAPESLYDDVYVLDPNVRGRYSAQTSEEQAKRSREAEQAPVSTAQAANDEIPQQLSHALAAGEDGGETLPTEGGGPA